MTLNCYNFIEISRDFHPTLWAAAALRSDRIWQICRRVSNGLLELLTFSICS